MIDESVYERNSFLSGLFFEAEVEESQRKLKFIFL